MGRAGERRGGEGEGEPLHYLVVGRDHPELYGEIASLFRGYPEIQVIVDRRRGERRKRREAFRKERRMANRRRRRGYFP